ncbi:activating signal cointegrator 1 complex subunit 2 isoform X2 [Scyliorhinus canicula]|uniref:activating signal cointegrator 1 complex subunit 2 isoform X2 n=1 Tax=Scyliorhinus canicula TaxID=7830 RepID=UPI0018F4CB46|nr:activating signal cointegrator 1 complex subunit 2 isoform X2 [Scyliorhinus canicula]
MYGSWFPGNVVLPQSSTNTTASVRDRQPFLPEEPKIKPTASCKGKYIMPRTLPLDQIQLPELDKRTGKTKQLPALHPSRKEDCYFVLYKPPPQDGTPVLVEEFLERANFIVGDLDWLLALPHDKFWCQVIFDESLQKCLDSFLRYTPRQYDESANPNPAVAEMQRRLHRCVFMTYLRMSTHKESKEHFITPEAFGEIIYDGFLFDIPKIFDLCVIFGKGNAALLKKMIENIFNQQPNYFNDLNETVPTILQVCSSICEKCGLRMENHSHGPQKIDAQTKVSLMDMPVQEFKDILLYLCDTCTTLFAFLEVFPEASRTIQKHDFIHGLATFYEIIVPELEDTIKKRRFDEISLQNDLWRRLSHSRKKMIETFHLIINYMCLQPILENGSEHILAFIEDFLQIFTALLHQKRFLTDYDEQFPVADDISLLQQAFPALDETRTSYIIKAVDSAWEASGRNKPAFAAGNAHISHAPGASHISAANGEIEQELKQPEYENDDDCAGATAAKITGVQLESLISHVKDILPHLGEGFILECLEEYDYNAEKVINNILEDKIRPSLCKLDRTLQREVKKDQESILSTRLNVFDHDEFDVFSRNSVDKSKIWKGKKKEKEGITLLDDKTHIAEQKERYKAYSIVVENVPVEAGEQFYAGDYDDEYDDTYDGGQVGANDVDSDDELISRRPFTIPRILRQKDEDGENDDDESEEEAPKEEGPKRDLFVQDPALLRERAEARRATFNARRGFKHDNTAALGNTKGQGQAKETVVERRKKEANKSLRANHNRRSLADRKRNKGMIPS